MTCMCAVAPPHICRRQAKVGHKPILNSHGATLCSQGMIDVTYPPLCTSNAVPSVLQRSFQNEDHARQFMAGHIRFGLLLHYREMEGCRQDETEGKALIRWNLEAENPNLHNVSYSGSSLNPYY